MSPAKVTLLMTRPKAASEVFVDGLDLGEAALCISPLMRMEAVGTLPDTDTIDGLVFTSANGVQAYADAGGTAKRFCFAVGDATARAAETVLDTAVLSARGDADALVALVERTVPPGTRLLHVRGRHSRGAVAERLSGAGMPTTEAVLYDQRVQPLSADARAVLDTPGLVLVPLFSPRSAALFLAERRGDARIWGVAISKAVDKAMPRHTFERVYVAAAPNSDAMRNAVARALLEAASLEGGSASG